MEILHPGDAVSKHLNGFLITPSNSSGINQTPIYIAQDPLSEPSYLVRPIDLNAGYKVIPKEGFEETAHFIDGPETLLRSELSRVSEELKRVQLRMDHYRAGLESVAFHLRWGRRQPHFTVFGAVSSTTAVVEYVLDKPIERIEKKRPKK